MPISLDDLRDLEGRINALVQPYQAAFELTFHFALDRVNDVRNQPPITIAEVEGIFTRLVAQHIVSIIALDNGDTFNVRCLTTHINIPCVVEKLARTAKNSITHKSIAVTIMRKQSFVAKDPIEFHV